MKSRINTTILILFGSLLISCSVNDAPSSIKNKITHSNDSLTLVIDSTVTFIVREDWNYNLASFKSFLDSVDRIVISNYECDIHRMNSKLTNKKSRHYFNLDSSYNYNKAVINKKVAIELFALMHKNDPGEYTVSACFDPHHVINFYSKGVNLGYFKICFKCNLIRSSENFKMISNLDPSSGSIRRLFRKHGCNQYKNKPEFKLNKLGRQRLGLEQ